MPMPDYKNAFEIGEEVEIASEAQVQEALVGWRSSEEKVAELKGQFGKRYQVSGYYFPHGSGVMYGLEGLNTAVWEGCLVDWRIRPGDPNWCAASEVFTIAVEEVNSRRYVVIRTLSGVVARQSYHADPDTVAKDFEEIAKMRVISAFQRMFLIEDPDRGQP